MDNDVRFGFALFAVVSFFFFIQIFFLKKNFICIYICTRLYFISIIHASSTPLRIFQKILFLFSIPPLTIPGFHFYIYTFSKYCPYCKYYFHR